MDSLFVSLCQLFFRLSNVSFLLRPALASTAAQQQTGLASFPPAQLTLTSLVCTYHRDGVSNAPPSLSPPPASLPLHFQLTLTRCLCIAHVPVDPPLPPMPSMQRSSTGTSPVAAPPFVAQVSAPLMSSSPPQPSASPTSSLTSAFHLMEFPSVTCQLDVDLRGLTTTAANVGQRADEANGDVDSVCTVQLQDVHLRAHPVISTWANLWLPLLPPTLTAAAAAASPRSGPTPPSFFHSPLRLPGSPVRVSFFVDHFSCSLHHIDRTPLVQLRFASLQASGAVSQPQRGYIGKLQLDSLGLYVYDALRGGGAVHHFDEREQADLFHRGRDCVLGMSQLSLPLSLTNASPPPSRSSSPAAWTHLLAGVSVEMSSLTVKHSSALLSHLPLLHSHFLSSHSRLHTAFLQRVQTRVLHSRLPRSSSFSSLSAAPSQPTLPLIVTLDVQVNSVRVTLPVDADDGFHALSLHVQTLRLRHELDSALWKLPFYRSQPGFLRLQSASLLLHHPYNRDDSPLTRLHNTPLLVSHGSVQEILSIGPTNLQLSRRSEQLMIDTIQVHVGSIGLSYSLWLQMSIFQLSRRLRDDRDDTRAFMAREHIGARGGREKMGVEGVVGASVHARPFAVVVVVDAVALELAFTEWKKAEDEEKQGGESYQSTTSAMTFYTRQLRFAHPASHSLPTQHLSTNWQCPHSLPITLSSGWWAINGVPILHWQQARLGGGRGSLRLPDVCCELRQGLFRLPFGFPFGRDVQLMIDRWKAFKGWRKAKRMQRQARGRPIESEHMTHRADLPHYPHAVDFDIGSLWLRLLDCSFQLCDDPAAVDAMDERRRGLSDWQAEREAELAGMVDWRVDACKDGTQQTGNGGGRDRSVSVSAAVWNSGTRKRRPSVSRASRTDDRTPLRDTLPRSRSLNFDELRQRSSASSSVDGRTSSPMGPTIPAARLLAVALVQAILERSMGSSSLTFPPPSAMPFTAPLLSINSPDVTFTVLCTHALQDISQLYRRARSLDPCQDPPYAAFIAAEDAARANNAGAKPSEAALATHNSFLELWGREVLLQGQRVELAWRDYPLPFITAKKVTMGGTLIIGQLQAPERWLFQQTTVLAPAALLPSSQQPNTLCPLPSPLVISIARGASIPTKLYYDMQWSAVELDVTYGMCYLPAFSGLAEAFNRLTPPATPRVGGTLAWWDDMRYKVHGRLRITAVDDFALRVMKSDSPYRRNFLQITATAVELLHVPSGFDGCAEDLLWTVLCDEHEGAYDGTTRGPDYVQGQLMAVPNARVRVELDWTCKPRADGVACHMYDHHLHHYNWNNPQTDVMLCYRARGLSYRVEVTVQPKQEKHKQHNHSRAQPLSYYTSQLSALPVSPDPISPSPSPHLNHRGLSSATSPTSADSGALPPSAQLLLARPPPTFAVPVLTLRWSAYTYFWHLIAMFQEPPLFLSPLSRRTTPSLGDLFSSLSLSVQCSSPRVELLHEDERVPGRINVLLLSAESFGVDWTWVAHYDDDGVKRYESQDMACDALHMHGRALVPEHAEDDEDERQREEEKAKWKARTRTKAQLAEAKTRMRLKAYMHQQRQREDGELVNFNDDSGNYCSPFERQPLGYHAEYFMATRVFAYRTHYPAPSATSPLSATSPPPARRVTSASAVASPSLPPSSSFGSSPRDSDRPPFDMPMQGGWHGEEWQELFGELMADKDSPDAMDAIWEGKPYTDEHSQLSRASEHEQSGQKAEETFPFASINPAEDDEDELFLRRHTLSVSGDGSEESERKLVEDAATTRLLLLMGERYAQRGAGKNIHARYHSDGSISYRQQTNGDPALIATGTSFFFTLHLPHSMPPLPPLPLSQPSLPPSSIGIGATRRRNAPLLQPRDVSGCSHRMLTINLKLLWSNHVKHSVTQWFEVFTQPYEPPAFVAAAREASLEWRLRGGNDRERGGSTVAVSPAVDEVKEEKNATDKQLEAKEDTAVDREDDEKAAASDAVELDQSFSSSAPPSTRIESSRASPLPAYSMSSPPSPESPHSEVRQSALDMLALVREADAAPLDASDTALLPSVASPLSTPSRKGSILDPNELAAAVDESLSSSSTFQPTWLRSLLRQWKDRRDDDNAWLSLFGFDLLRPQITFQSRDTNSRLVLAAASARIDSEGLPIHVQRREKDACTELVPCGQHQLESFVYFEKKHVATLSAAQAFVCPVDVEGDERVHWVKDSMVRQEEEGKEERDVEPTRLASDYSDPTPTSGGRKKGFTGFWNLDAAKETAADDNVAVVSSRELTGSGVLRKIVEPCTMHFAMMQQCDIASELHARQLFVADDANGIVMPIADKPVRRQSTVHTSPPASQGMADGDDKDRPLRQCIKLFLPAFSAHLDSNEYFTLLGVVQALFLFSPAAPPQTPLPSHPASRSPTPPPLSKEDYQALMESVLEAEHALRSAQSSSHRARAQQVRRVVQLFLGGSTWQLSQHSSPFIAAHVNGLLANHTFYDDGSSDNEINIDFLTLQSKLLSPSDPLANLLIPDPDRWMQRDVKRDKMVSVRAKVHSPLKPDDERLAGVTVYEHFEVTVFPLVLRFPHDHYVAIRSYFFPDSLHDMSEEEKTKASENFFQMPKKWGKGSRSRHIPTAEVNTTRGQSIGTTQLQRRGSMSARESPLPSPTNMSSPSYAAVAAPRRSGGHDSAHSSPLSSPNHSPAALPPFSPARQLPAGHYSPVISSRASSGSASNLLNTGSTSVSVPTDFAPFSRPRFDSRAMVFDSSAAPLRSPLNATQPIPIISKPTKPVTPTGRRQRKASTRSSTTASPAATVSMRYFRYVRINQLNFLASYHGETSFTSLENVRINIAPFNRNKRCWTWRQFVSKVEKHTIMRIFSQVDHIIARKLGRKVDDGSGVQSLSQKFMELFTQREEEMDERRLLGFPAKASNQPTAAAAGQGGGVVAAEENKSGEGAAGRFFRMPSMSAVHMPQLNLGSMGEELAAKAILLFGSKKEKQKLEKEEKQKEKERKRLLKEQQQQAQKQQQQQQAMAATQHHAAAMRVTPPTSPTLVAANGPLPSPSSRPPLPSRPSLTSIQPLPPPYIAPAAPAAVSPTAHSYPHPSGVPTHSLRIDPSAPPALIPMFASPRAPPDLGMLALLKKKSRPLPTAPAAAQPSAPPILTSPQAQLANYTNNGILSPSSSPVFSTSFHNEYGGGPHTSPPLQPTASLSSRVFFPKTQPSSLSSSMSPSCVSPYASAHASASASASSSTSASPPPAGSPHGPRRPPRPPASHPAIVAATTGAAIVRASPARPSLPPLVRTQLAAHARSRSDISELIFMHTVTQDHQQLQQQES